MPYLSRLAIILLALVASCTPVPHGRQEVVASAAPAPVILISIDGFKPSYLDRGVTPNLNRLAAAGVRGAGMRPAFPSVTFPNHYTLVTGLRPDQHGIVANTMDDPNIPGVRFSLSNQAAITDHRWWDEAEPVWVTAEKQGVHSATMFWPGSEAAIHGVRPSYWKPYDGKVPANARVDTVLGWLDLPMSQRPRFVTLYFDDVDHAGHKGGPDAPATTEAASHVDEAVGRLVSGLQSRHLVADIIVVSDHGMAATSPERLIQLDTVAPPSSYDAVTTGTSAGLNPRPGQEATLAAALLAPHDHMQCWRKGSIPGRFHYGHNARVPSFFCLAEVGWLIVSGEKGGERGNGGAHGYDNAAPEMRATFLAAGPAFRPASTLPVFDNVDVYPLVMNLIGVPSLPSDGKLSTFSRVRSGKTIAGLASIR